MLYTQATKTCTITGSASHATCVSMPYTRATKPCTLASSASYARSSSSWSRSSSHRYSHFDNLFSIVLCYGHAIAPNAKPWENRDIALLVMGPEFYGTAMVSCKCQPANFALWTVAKQGAFLWDRPWDPNISFGSQGLQPQHLEDKVFLMGQGMLGNKILWQELTRKMIQSSNQTKEKKKTEGPNGTSQNPITWMITQH